MTTALLHELSSYFNNMDPEDPVYQKELIRPAEIKEDVKLMEQRKRVTNIMRSKLFKKNLENIFKLHHGDGDAEGDSTSTLSLADISEQLLLSSLPKNKIDNLYQLSQRKGVICINDLHYGSNSPYEHQERLFRCKLASVFRLIDMYGWNCGFNATMTVRPFRDREQFLINPFGLMTHEITASSLLSLDFKGNILDFGSTVLESHLTHWHIHAAIYSSRSDTRTILHLRTPAAVSVSCLDHGLLPLSTEAMILGEILVLKQLSEIEYDSKITSLNLANLKNYLTTVLTVKSKVLIMPNNGILICAETVEEGWHLLTNCQQACEIQLKLGNLNMDDLFIPQRSVQDSVFNQWGTTDIGGIKKTGDMKADLHSHWRIGELEFEALMRHLDNNGYRTGYFYNQENIYSDELSTKSEPHKPRYEVEIPPSCISTVRTSKQQDDIADQSRDESNLNKMPLRMKSDKWFNTPNSFKLIEENGDNVNNLSFNFQDSQLSERKSAKWVSTTKKTLTAPNPQHPVTAGAYVVFGDDTAKLKDRAQSLINPKELKENQRRVKDKYYHDTNTAGPISCLLDSGLSRDEARRLKNATLQKQIGPGASSDQIVTAASKAIIQRGHKAIVYQDLYKPANPFENVTTDMLDSYHKEVDRKLHPDRYHDDSCNLDSSSRDVAPEIRITASQSESVMKQRNQDNDQSIRKPAVSELLAEGPESMDQIKSNENIQCHPFFQSDFEEDFRNLRLTYTERSSTLNPPNSQVASSVSDSPTVSPKKFDTLPVNVSVPDKIVKRKSFGSFSFHRLGRSKSVKDNADVPTAKGATLAAPGCGAMTSETSGPDVSHDEGDKEGKSKKKKRRFKLPSFSKKKKDKPAKN